MLYTSGSLALATLEVLVHMAPERRVSGDLPIMVAVEIDLPEALIQKAVDMPLDHAATQSFGDAWLAECAALALEVPSRVIPVESNVLINPAHPQAVSIRLIRQIPFVFDDRLGR